MKQANPVNKMNDVKSDNLKRALRGDVLSTECPSRDIVKHVTGRWGVLIFLALSDGELHRFSAIRRKIQGISEKMLTQNLKQLENDGLVERIVYPVVPPHVEYRLTSLGCELGNQVIGLVDWIEDNIGAIMEHKRSA